MRGPEASQSSQQQLTHLETSTLEQQQPQGRAGAWAGSGPTPPAARLRVVLHKRCQGAVHLVDQALVVKQQQASLHTVAVHHTPKLHPQLAHRGEGGEQHLSQVLCSQLLCLWLCQGCDASLLLCGCVVPPEAQQQLQIILEAGLVGHEDIGNQQLVDDAYEPPAEAELGGPLVGMLADSGSVMQ